MGHHLSILLLVALGGAVGGVGRFFVTNLATRLGSSFPWGTLAVNTSGAFAAGWLLGTLSLPDGLPSSQWALWVVGVLGGYTTVSSFSLQTLALWQRGNALSAVANLLATCALGFAMVSAGWWLAGGNA